MAETLTTSLRLASQASVIEPQLILEIEGVDTIYGAQVVMKRIKVGDAGLVIGGGWRIGGLNEVEDQSDLISLKDGTTQTIRQTLNQDKGIGSSISSMQICLIDKDQEATRLISPGVVVEDLLGRKAKVYWGVLGNTAFPNDFLCIFRGVCDSIDSRQGNVLLNISSPEVKKRQELFRSEEFTLNGAVNATDDPQVNEFNNLIEPADEFTPYLKVGDEYIEITNVLSDLGLFTSARASLGSVAASHSDGDSATLVYRLEGNIIDIALKLMLSGRDSLGVKTNYAEGLSVSSINYINDATTIQNTLYFNGIDLVQKYGVTVGDFLYLTGSAEGDNNNAGKWTIDEINTTDYIGTVLTISVATETQLVSETESTASVSLLSQYNVFPSGLGLSMVPDEVDVAEHLRLKRLFLSSFEVDIIMTEAMNGREFIEQELYAPAGCYSLPRKARSSIGILSAPIPGSEIKVLNADNITNAKSLTTRRTISSNFYNEIVYRYDWDLEDDEPSRGVVYRDEDSINRIKSGKKTLVIESRGIRQSLNGGTITAAAAQRRLNRYKLAAEEIEQVKVMFSVGFNIEIGDLVILEGDGVNLVNSAQGNRSPAPRLFEVTNKSVNILTSEIVLKLVDTSFDTSARYGLISPASYIKTGLSATQFIIEESFNSIYGANEYLKWAPWVTSGSKAAVQIRNADFSTVGYGVIENISGNKITLQTALAFTPSAGMILEFAPYDNANTTDQQKLVFAYFADNAGDNFGDGKSPYQYI